MCSLLTEILATAIAPPSVPDGGTAGLLLGLGIVSLGIAARFLKNRKR